LQIEIGDEIYNSITENNKLKCRFFIGKIVDEDNLQLIEQSGVKFLEAHEIYTLDLFEGDEKVVDMLIHLNKT